MPANSVERYINKALLIDKKLILPPPVVCSTHPTQYNTHNAGVFDSGDRNIYFAKKAPIQKFDDATTKVHIGTANGQVQRSFDMGTLKLSHLPYNFPCTGHVMPYFKYNLIGIGSIFYDDCKVFFAKHVVVVYDPQHQPIITGLQETTGSKLWHIFMPISNIHSCATY